MTSAQLLQRIRNHESLSASEQRSLIWALSWPAIMAQISTTVMQLLDMGMVGRLGTNASAAIGLVASTTWLVNGVSNGMTFGFSVQTSQAIGAREYKKAASLCRQGLIAIFVFSLPMALFMSLMSFSIPVWLGGEQVVLHDAGLYLLVYSLTIPFYMLNSWAMQMLQATGDTKVPGMAQVVMCFLDVTFNALFIFGMNLGVMGAALGTSVSVLCTSLFLTGWIFIKNAFLKDKASWRFTKHSLRSALRIGGPISAEQLITGTSYVAMTRIVSSLGTLSIASHSFAVTAESLCYMPAFGFASAASALIGQCIGANRIELSRQIAWRVTRITIGMMFFCGTVMFILSRILIAMLSPDPAVIEIGSMLLKMEAFAEPMYGASIVITGILRGKGDTLWPACLNLISIWGVRIPLAWLLSIPYGLYGVWAAMVLELNVRGILFLLRQRKAFHPNPNDPEFAGNI